MKKIIPFKKELFLKNNIAEITSISLEHTLHHEKDYLITGEFIISGEYKITDASINTESFEFKIPFDINIDDNYDLDHMIIDIDDFYYEIINNNALNINIDVLLDKLEEKKRCVEEEVIEGKEKIETIFDSPKEEIKDIIAEKIISNNIEDKISLVEEKIDTAKEKIEEVKDKIKGFVTYRVYIIKEEDTVEKIIDRYKTDRDILEQYNSLQELKVGDKIIIPSNE